jgi:hypothetical protein
MTEDNKKVKSVEGKSGTASAGSVSSDLLGSRVLTCVYCGHEYPDGTPSWNSQALTDHIKICEKHPMRQAEAKIKKLRAALIGLIGAVDKAELEKMEALIRIAPVPDIDKTAGINAIQALLDTASQQSNRRKSRL